MGSRATQSPGAAGVFLDEAVTLNELLIERVAERSGVIAPRVEEKAGARIEAARREAGIGKLEEGLMLVDCESVRVGRNVGNE